MVVTTALSVKGHVLCGQGTSIATGEVISLLEAKQTNISPSMPARGEIVQPAPSGRALDSNACRWLGGAEYLHCSRHRTEDAVSTQKEKALSL